MKNILYKIFANVFNRHVKKGVIKNRVCLLSIHNANFTDSLGLVYEQLSQREDLEIIKIDKNKPLSFFFTAPYKLSRAAYIFMNDNFMPLADLDVSPDTEIIQLWHGQGVFKKFGLDIEVDEDIRKREEAGDAKISYVICSSEGVRDIYAHAFNTDVEKVLPLGKADSDYFFEPHDTYEIRKKFDEMYPACEGKKLVLYAPTFRDDKKADEKLLDNFMADKVVKALGDDYALLVRLHPQVHSTQCVMNSAHDVTGYKSVNELCLMCDILITDYSSICMDFAILEKPMIFYAFDLEEYKSTRDFYYDYESYVPGKVVKSFPELLDALEKKDFDEYKSDKFKYFNFGVPDGKASERIAELVK